MAATKIVRKKLSDLSPDSKNARRHGDRNLAAIAASLSRFGQRKPIVILPDGEIVAGNGTFDAAHSLGWTHIEAVVFDGTPDEARAFAIADNRTGDLAEWDMQQLLETLGELDSALIEASGWDMREIEALLTPSVPAVDEWGGLTDFDQPDATAARTVVVSFPSEDAHRQFFIMLERDPAKRIWWPSDPADTGINQEHEYTAELA